jgi:hypothetical protein
MAALQEAGVSISEEQLDERVATAIREILGWERPESLQSEFSSEERATLGDAGFDLRSRRPDEPSPSLSAAERYAALLASALTVAEAARRLGVDGSRIRQRLLARQLYGIRRRQGWLLPRFQFSDTGLVPGIEQVLSRLPPDLHPLVVAAWFTYPHSDLARPDDLEEAPTSPREWLLGGGNARIVADLAEDAAGYA